VLAITDLLQTVRKEKATMKKEIVMPKIGLDMEEGTIETWEKKVGDRVAEGDVLCKIETDKAVTDVESTVNGTLCEIVAQEGDTVEITKTIAWIEVDG
jgi:hypothetical protein